ncbi:MAG: imidazole glycerol phosphate synthase subunit HisH [Candidatus Magasanikbacteria bacterium]|nr:imidazole glycerol phosphate synthase subunit HisH [Candidatus Magasanikbacteria bacterium]
MIAIIDYGMGNLGSIANALEYVGGDVVITSEPKDVRDADRIVLPGVGAFGDGIKHLKDTGWIAALNEEVIVHKKPFLGVCLGMQLLAKKSFEFGEHDGLGWFDAEVRRFSFSPESGLCVPHVGWNDISIEISHPVLNGIPDRSDFYFVHSYAIEDIENSSLVASSDYGKKFAAIIARENIFATQFHPEKSQKWGLRLLKNFIDWQP